MQRKRPCIDRGISLISFPVSIYFTMVCTLSLPSSETPTGMRWIPGILVKFTIFHETIWIESEWIIVNFVIMQHRPIKKLSLQNINLQGKIYHELAMTMDPAGIRYPLYSSSTISWCGSPVRGIIRLDEATVRRESRN